MCFGLFVKHETIFEGTHNGGIWLVPRGGPRGSRAPAERRSPLCGGGLEEAHTGPFQKNEQLASIFPFNSLPPLREGVDYNTGERLRLVPFCVSLCCDSSFWKGVCLHMRTQGFCNSRVLGDPLRASDPHPLTSIEISTLLYASSSPYL